MAETVRDALQGRIAIEQQAKEGFTEVIVRNPENKNERILVLPSKRF
jgi:hypothetical protein